MHRVFSINMYIRCWYPRDIFCISHGKYMSCVYSITWDLFCATYHLPLSVNPWTWITNVILRMWYLISRYYIWGMNGIIHNKSYDTSLKEYPFDYVGFIICSVPYCMPSRSFKFANEYNDRMDGHWISRRIYTIWPLDWYNFSIIAVGRIDKY